MWAVFDQTGVAYSAAEKARPSAENLRVSVKDPNVMPINLWRVLLRILILVLTDVL